MRGAWILIAALWVLAAAGPGSAQQQAAPRDPFQGQFGAGEAASAPGEAARLAVLMGDALEGLAPQTAGELDVYLITASLWGDPVFESEATQAEAILREHFDVDADHSILLSAGGRPERAYPTATPNNIAAAIGQVGSLIDPEEDLVVIFLTSHGSHDGAMGLRETNRLAGQMRPTHLRDMLSAAGVRKRVVIVSACFSGAFIAPLMDSDTIVLTAAAPDRSSFGCQPSRDWTFFGDAYFSSSLRGGASLLDAFDQAKVLIERWEREQNLTPPSNPQRYVGSRAAAMVREAETRH
jgi:hypothetical protein